MLSKRYRLRARGSYNYLRARGVKYSGQYLTFIALKGNCKRIGFIVSNKIGKATKRNLVKRRMRAIAQELLPRLSSGQMVFVAKLGITDRAYAEIKEGMTHLVQKAGFLRSV